MVPKKSRFCPKGPNFAIVASFRAKSQIPNPVSERLNNLILWHYTFLSNDLTASRVWLAAWELTAEKFFQIVPTAGGHLRHRKQSNSVQCECHNTCFKLLLHDRCNSGQLRAHSEIPLTVITKRSLRDDSENTQTHTRSKLRVNWKNTNRALSVHPESIHLTTCGAYLQDTIFSWDTH